MYHTRSPLRNPATSAFAAAVLLAFSCARPLGAASTIEVDPAGGASFTAIQPAIDAASDGDTLLLRPAEYPIDTPITFRGKAIRITSEAGPEATVIRMSDEPADRFRSSVLIFESGETENSVLEDVTVTGGRGSEWGGSFEDEGGGGVLCIGGSSPTLVRVTLAGNSATFMGGGLYCDTTSAPTLVDCTFHDNSAYRGAGLYSAGAAPIVTGCLFHDNAAPSGGGGGFYNAGGQPQITACTFVANRGGQENAFSPESGGGAAYNEGGAPTFVNCLFTGNASFNNRGGAVRNTAAASPAFVNCTFTGNSAGGGEGGGIHSDSSDAVLTNCVLWGNTDAGGSGAGAQIAGGIPVVTFSCVQDGAPGDGSIPFGGAAQGNTDADPGLFDPDGPDDVPGTLDDDPRLRPDSPCIDAGDNAALPAGVTVDLDGDPRSVDDPATADTGSGGAPVVDMGAYEWPKQGLVLSSAAIRVPEGATAVFTVRLAVPPPAPVTVTVVRASGDPDLEVVSGASLVFDETNFSAAQEVTLGARDDEDSFDGTARFLMAGEGLRAAGVSAAEADDEDFPTTFQVNSADGDDDADGLTDDTALATIARAVELAEDGDLVLVADGEYEDRGEGNDPVVDFHGKAITIRSLNGPGTCILRGGEYVVDFHTGEGPASVLSGFTITGGDPGGALRCDGASPTITHLIVEGNWSEYNNGALWFSGSSARVAGSLITLNASFGPCAGVFCTDGSAVTLVNCTVTANQVGGVWCDDTSSAALTNCILWSNNADYDVRGATAAYSCLEYPVPGPGTISSDPRFVRPSQGDWRLEADSPAVDTGTADGAPATDLDGNGRPCGGGVDMGAYERGDCPASAGLFRRGDANADGGVNIADAIAILTYLFGGGAVPDCLKSTDSNDDAAVNVADAIHVLGYLFGGGPAPLAPFEECGTDPTLDALSCEEFPPCAGGGGP